MWDNPGVSVTSHDDERAIVANARTLLGVAADVDARARTVTSGAPMRTQRPRGPLLQLAIADRASASAEIDLEIDGVLGEGGMGVVELARQRSLGRDVAIKRLKPGALDAAHVAALLDEAMTTGSLEHPGIVPVHALGRDANGRPAIVMKRVEGITLRALLEEPEHAAWERARGDRERYLVEIAIEIAEALAFAHSRRYVHCDVKPDNVMLGEFGEVYLLEWGIACALGAPAKSIAGTLAYMAPEMLRPGAAPLDARTDVYLLAATLHECLTGEPPHSGQTIEALLFSIARSEPPRYAPEVSVELAAILASAMHCDPAERPASMHALRDRLQDHLAHRSAGALAEAAAARRIELERRIAEGGDPIAIHADFHACRFGLEQSLREWPENDAARRDLRAALIAMASFEIAQKNSVAAAALAAAIDDPPAELAQGLKALEADLARDAARRAKMDRHEREHDAGVSRRQREIVSRVFAVLLTFGGVTLLAGTATDVLRPNASIALYATIPLTIIAPLVAYLGRRYFFSNRVNRHITLVLLLVLAGMVLERIGAVARGRDIVDIAAADAIVVATAAAIASLSIRRLYAIPAIILAVASLTTSFVPSIGIAAVIAGAMISVATLLAAGDRGRTAWLDEKES